MSSRGELLVAATIEPTGGESLLAILWALSSLLPEEWRVNFDFSGCLTEEEVDVRRALELANARQTTLDDIKFFAESCRLGPDNEFWSQLTDNGSPIAIESFNFSPWDVLVSERDIYKVREKLSCYWGLLWLSDGVYRLRKKRDPSNELHVELLFYRLVVSCLEDGFTEEELLEARSSVLNGEYGVAVTNVYWVIASKAGIVSEKTKLRLQALSGAAPPDGDVSEQAHDLGLPAPEFGLIEP